MKANRRVRDLRRRPKSELRTLLVTRECRAAVTTAVCNSGGGKRFDSRLVLRSYDR